MSRTCSKVLTFFFVGLIIVSPFSYTSAEEAELTTTEAEQIILEEYYGSDGETYAADEVYLNPEDIPDEEFFRAEIVEIIDERTEEIYEGFVEEIQIVRARILNGADKDTIIETTHGGVVSIDQYQKVEVGDTVVLIKTYKIDGGHDYFIQDHYRLGPLIIIFALFAALAVFFGRSRGFGSLLGLGFSILILSQYIVPSIIAGKDPLMTTLVGGFTIAAVSLYLAHGFTRRTSVALLSTSITLIIALGLSHLFVRFAHLFGKGSEDAFYIQVGQLAHIDLRGLLLAGIVIGTLGVLDDITTAQTAVVGELRQANQKLSVRELYRRGIVVGREHIASLVNTLVLAYAGASLPLFILFTVNEHAPLWLKLNSEIVAEEFIRTIIGSSALILAVPIATLLAAHFLKNEKIQEGSKPTHAHTH